jgi:hypothetical protein
VQGGPHHTSDMRDAFVDKRVHVCPRESCRLVRPCRLRLMNEMS